MLPIMNRPIPIVADEAVDLEFGTGAVKITPGHDPLDFEIGQRHKLPIINLLNPDGTLNENAGPYAGQTVIEARKGVVEQLEREGLAAQRRSRTPTRCPTASAATPCWSRSMSEAVVREHEAAGRARHRRRAQDGA